MANNDHVPPRWNLLASDLAACLRFYSRLPMPVLAHETEPHAMPDFSRLARVLPIAGALIGTLGAIVLAIAAWAGLPSLISAMLAIAAVLVSTGAMHEDGLADCADGFGGGATKERKLEIMKDSRIGTFGGAALVISLVLRTAALAALAGHSKVWGVLAVIAGASFSRVCGLLPLVLLKPARPDGLGHSAGPPSAPALVVAGGLAIAVGLVPLAGGVPLSPLLAAMFWAIVAAYGITRVAAAQIGGQSGDVAGAAQQLAEIAYLVALTPLVGGA